MSYTGSAISTTRGSDLWLDHEADHEDQTAGKCKPVRMATALARCKATRCLNHGGMVRDIFGEADSFQRKGWMRVDLAMHIQDVA